MRGVHETPRGESHDGSLRVDFDRRLKLEFHYASFRRHAGSWTKPRRVVTQLEWHPGELYPRVGFIVTNMTRRPSGW